MPTEAESQPPPETSMEGIKLQLEATEKYRTNLEPSLPFGKLQNYKSFEATELDEALTELDKTVATGEFSALDKINHRELYTIKRDYTYANKCRCAIYVHAYRSKLIKQCINKASKLIIEKGEEV